MAKRVKILPHAGLYLLSLWEIGSVAIAFGYGFLTKTSIARFCLNLVNKGVDNIPHIMPLLGFLQSFLLYGKWICRPTKDIKTNQPYM